MNNENKIDTQFFYRCIQTLDQAYQMLLKADPENLEYDLYRSACVKEFELILEQAGKLLKKCLRDYFHSSAAVNRLVFKDIFRQATQHGLITIEQTERWLLYRDNRNSTAHDYGEKFAENTLVLLPDFIKDATALELVIKEHKHD